MKYFIDKIQSSFIYASIDAVLFVPVKITKMLFDRSDYKIFVERYFKNDKFMNFDLKVIKSLNTFVFNVNLTPVINELIIKKGSFSFSDSVHKCSFYGEKDDYDSKSTRFIESNSLISFQHLFSKEIKGTEIIALSHGKEKFIWNTVCTGNLWYKKMSNEYFLGLKYTDPESKNPAADHYYLKTDKLFSNSESLKIIRNSIFELTGSNKVVFDKTGQMDEIANLEFRL